MNAFLQGRYIANEPGLGIRHGCFDTWFAKKDVTQQHSMVEMTYAYGGGNMLAGEVCPLHGWLAASQ